MFVSYYLGDDYYIFQRKPGHPDFVDEKGESFDQLVDTMIDYRIQNHDTDDLIDIYMNGITGFSDQDLENFLTDYNDTFGTWYDCNTLKKVVKENVSKVLIKGETYVLSLNFLSGSDSSDRWRLIREVVYRGDWETVSRFDPSNIPIGIYKGNFEHYIYVSKNMIEDLNQESRISFISEIKVIEEKVKE